jgi:predicted RNA polymerase sigma factor
VSTVDGGGDVEQVLREVAPKALGIVARTWSFGDAEDAVQEASILAHAKWSALGVPERPLGWLVRVAQRHLIGRHRTDTARRRREELVAAWAYVAPDPVAAVDDSLAVLAMCCHPRLTPGAAIPLTLRAVGGLTTREIADAFMVPESTMAQRISRAKATIAGLPLTAPATIASDPDRVANVLHVIYLIFNEGHTATHGEALVRGDLAAEAVHLARLVHAALPDHPEASGLLALTLLTSARGPARLADDGRVIPLDQQDRARWDRSMITEGLSMLTGAMRQQRPGEYQLLAAITAIHDQAPTYADTRWAEIDQLYRALAAITPNPHVALNRAVAVAHVEGPRAGLALLETVADQLGEAHRFHATRAHLFEMLGDHAAAAGAYRAAAELAGNDAERAHLERKAAGNVR